MKTYLLTGATSGIGRAVAEKLLADGHRVLAMVRAGRHAGLPDGISATIEADFADLAATEGAFAALTTPLDGIVNAAGILPGKSYSEIDMTVLEEMFRINVLGPMLMLKHVAPRIRDGGCVVLFGSISGHKGSYDDGYAASKGAVHSLVRSLALKLAPKVRVVGIAPGMTDDTGMTRELVPGRREHTLKLVPMADGGKPADMAALTAFVLSDACRFMTGSILDINGGQYLRT